MSVSTITEVQAEAAKARHLAETLMGGTAAMRRAGETYLPKEPAEGDNSYQIRLNRTFLFAAFKKTVGDMAGKVFSKPLRFDTDMAAKLKDWSENIDLAGTHVNNFAFEILKCGLVTGIEYIFVDMPAAIEGATRADEKRAGVRPYMTHLRPSDILGWKTRVVAGKMTLTQIRIRETQAEEDPDDAYVDRDVQRIRVLELDPITGEVTFEVHEKRGEDDGEEWVRVQNGTISVPFIPVFPVYINRTGFMTGEPPLQGLADLNLAHWQSQSDQRNILHVARVPILFGSGFAQDESLVVGPNSVTLASDPQARLAYVEHNGNAINSGMDDLKSLEFQMQTMGLELLIPRPGGETATGAAIDQAKVQSPLAMMADALKDGLENAYVAMSIYAGMGDKAGSVIINKEFGLSIRAGEEARDIIQAANAGLISRRTAWEELKRRGFLSEDFNPDDEEERLADEAPALGEMGMGGNDPNAPPTNPDQAGDQQAA